MFSIRYDWASGCHTTIWTFRCQILSLFFGAFLTSLHHFAPLITFLRPSASLASKSCVLPLSPWPWVFIHKLSLDNSLYILNASYVAHIVRVPLYVFTHINFLNPHDNSMNQMVLLSLLKRLRKFSNERKKYAGLHQNF